MEMKMKYERKTEEVRALLKSGRVLSVEDFRDVLGDRPTTSVYAEIRKLVVAGMMMAVGKGLYQAVPRPVYRVTISPRMREVNDYLMMECSGIRCCISEKNDVLTVSAYKSEVAVVLDTLRKKYGKTLTKKEAMRFPQPLSGLHHPTDKRM